MIPQHGTLEISQSRLRHNLRILLDKIGPDVKLCATIKGNAYGHGDSLLLLHLTTQFDCHWLAFYSLQEIKMIIKMMDRFLDSNSCNVLVLAPLVLRSEPDPAWLAQLHHVVRLNLTDLESAQLLSQALARAGRDIPLKVHVQIDTGLTRAGVDPADAESLANAIAAQPHLQLEGIFAHLSHGDTPGHPTLEKQHATLMRIATPLKQKYPQLIVHLQNSGGAFHIKDAKLDMVRIGIAMYGLQPAGCAGTPHHIDGLQPIAQLTAPILAIHERPAGTGVGYGHTFVTTRPSRLAIVPVGYADGYPRQISNTNNAIVQIGSATVPVVGRVSMDQIIVDITDVPAAKLGDRVVVISNDPTLPNSLDQIAAATGTINYELATHFGERLERVMVN